jgi:hypothetical protein
VRLPPRRGHHPASAGDDLGLAELRAALAAARAAYQVERADRSRPADNRQPGRAQLLACLEEYAAALVDRRLPVPPGIRDELRLR